MNKTRNCLMIAFFVLSIGPTQAQETNYAAEMKAVHQKMMSEMSAMSPSADPDKDFAMMMIPHHQSAIDMAELQLKYGKDPELKKMAQEIIEAQKREISDFEKWLAAQR